ncbi:MAG: hypothetical protein M1822_004392 [Bathelium mastoideum]|nr:MAG: hypothetical protein M1822_004392 [Bathelium mastoideum]
MAAAPIDAKALHFWDDAFQHPILVVRQLEKRLRADIEENREKLRALVGSSYRDLLGTAERIIEMDGQMQQVEATLGDIGLECNSRVLEKINRNMENMTKFKASQVAEEHGFASQLFVLQGCHTVIVRLLRRSGSSLLAAKVLVIARLLHKALANTPSHAPLVDGLRDKLAHVRTKLLKYIDMTFADPYVDKSVLIESMHAFCLATSSTPTDVLRHFHHVRSEAISGKLRESTDVQTAVLDTMKLFISTLQDTQSVFPKKLAIALETSKTQPLLQDPSILELAELQLDIHGRWVTEEIRQFTPRPRHDQLQKSEAEALLRSWASDAMGSFLSGLRYVLDSEINLMKLVEIRKELLELWLSSLQPSSTSEAADVLDDLRKVMMEKIAEALHGRANGLRFVSHAISSTISHWQPGIANSEISLWDPTTVTVNVGNELAQGIQSILARQHGRSKAVDEVLLAFDKWIQSIEEAQLIIKKMKETRWDEDPDDIALDILPEPPQSLLSTKDPRALEQTLEDAVGEAFQHLRRDLDAMDKALLDEQQSGEKAIFLLRALRELRRRVPRLGVILASKFSASLHATSVETSSRQLLAASVSDGLIPTLHASVRQYLERNHCPARALWEGTPALPVQPSPAAFKFLRELTKNMSNSGHDLWNTMTVNAVKVHLLSARTTGLLELINASDSESKPPPLNGHQQEEEPEQAGNEDEDSKPEEGEAQEMEKTKATPQSVPDSSTASQECSTQLLLDVLYLDNALAAQAKNSLQKDDQFDKVTAELTKRANIDKAARQRLEKSSADYWKKTYLLFALLA